ncbi:heme A synthase [Lichenicoccus roseus]|uniref:Heme A synthase n=2 Tax=Lichenicoccus roseus TaxID=2683649 RepID=A0A5R9J9F9_9PROT|nr:COX15/CtaA family protein [Lichenicoccus roseus]TLU74230.1 heme A synthase [Lichenicoccus roseus]
MPSDAVLLQGGLELGGGDRPATLATRNAHLVSLWLFTLCGMLLVMIALGGATRLTGSGLSIMEWRPVTGIIPPLTHAQWEHEFALYQTIPQYRILHDGFGLAGFQRIFWLEWIHRFCGRLIGLMLFVPLLVFSLNGTIGTRLAIRLALLFVLGGLQGGIGWFMVASGFDPDSTRVEPVRLVLHLCFAFSLYAAILWTALGVRTPRPAGLDAGRGVAWTRGLAIASAVLIALAIVAGGFTAGTHAGFTYNTYPDMDGHLLPPHYARLVPFWRNLVENLGTVQFDHRALASLSVVAVALTLLVGLRSTLHKPARDALMLLGWGVLAQYALGVTTLLLVVPVWAGTLHQTFAAVLLTLLIVLLHRLRRPAAF